MIAHIFLHIRFVFIFTHTERVGKMLSLKNSLYIPKDTKLKNINRYPIISQTFNLSGKSFHIPKDTKIQKFVVLSLIL